MQSNYFKCIYVNLQLYLFHRSSTKLCLKGLLRLFHHSNTKMFLLHLFCTSYKSVCCTQPTLAPCYHTIKVSIPGRAQCYLRYQGIDDINDTVHCPPQRVPTLPRPREIGIGGNGFQIIYKNPVKPHCTLSLLVILRDWRRVLRVRRDIEEIANSFHDFHNFHGQQLMTFRKLSWEKIHYFIFILLFWDNEA